MYVVGVSSMYVGTGSHTMRARIFLPEYVQIYYRLYVKKAC